MIWRTTFFAQAQSDNQVRKLLNRNKAAYSHQLHYLQMATEKLAKSLMTSPTAAEAPTFSHAAFVSRPRAIKGRPEIRARLGFANRTAFFSFIDGLLPLAEQVQQLAPNFSGGVRPNPEYPWKPHPDHEVIVPAEYDFADF
jgi:hypothetical protein